MMGRLGSEGQGSGKSKAAAIPPRFSYDRGGFLDVILGSFLLAKCINLVICVYDEVHSNVFKAS